MSVMPEASSALFMSQFSDEAVRDAIARVSYTLYFIHVLHRRLGSCVMGMYYLVVLLDVFKTS